MESVQIKATRQRLGCTQVQFAELLGMTQSGVSQLEKGRVKPVAGTRRMIEVLGQVPKHRIRTKHWVALIDAGTATAALIWLLMGKRKG